LPVLKTGTMAACFHSVIIMIIIIIIDREFLANRPDIIVKIGQNLLIDY
jgi:hypothetical protein